MLKKSVLLLVGLLVSSTASLAGTPELSASHPQVYVVQRGDTLWDIAARFLVKPWRWPEIWRANPAVRNPNLIYPGDRLTLVYVDGQPVITLAAGETYLGGRSYKRTPVARTEPNVAAVATIPLDAIGPFLSRPGITTLAEMRDAPYVIASHDNHLVSTSGDRIYVRGKLDPNVTRYSILRQGKPYRRAGDDTVLGYEALEVGDAVLERTDDPMTFLVTRGVREVLVGDRLFPQKEDEFPAFMPRAPEVPVTGHVISLIDAVSQAGQYQVVLLDAGSAQGLAPGHVLSIYTGKGTGTARDTIAAQRRYAEPAPIRFTHADTNPFDAFLSNLYNDVRKTKRAVDNIFNVESGFDVETIELPQEHTGELMVFRVFDQVSYALVMDIVRPVHLDDVVKNPQ